MGYKQDIITEPLEIRCYQSGTDTDSVKYMASLESAWEYLKDKRIMKNEPIADIIASPMVKIVIANGIHEITQDFILFGHPDGTEIYICGASDLIPCPASITVNNGSNLISSDIDLFGLGYDVQIGDVIEIPYGVGYTEHLIKDITDSKNAIIVGTYPYINLTSSACLMSLPSKTILNIPRTKIITNNYMQTFAYCLGKTHLSLNSLTFKMKDEAGLNYNFLWAEAGGSVYIQRCNIDSYNQLESWDWGVSAYQGQVTVNFSTVNNCGLGGITGYNQGSINANTVMIKYCQYGILAQLGSYVYTALLDFEGCSADTSPALNIRGNGEAYIYNA